MIKKISDYFWGLVLLGIFVGFIYKMSYWPIADHYLKKNAVYTKAVIIDEKNALRGPGQDFSYSYSFVINGKAYTNDAKDTELKVGDSIEVKYVRNWPFFNRPVNAKY